MRRSPFLWILILLVCLFIFSYLAPAEKILGASARVVYLHGVWVWAALASFFTAALIGLIGLLTRAGHPGKEKIHRWSRAWGRTGLVFWITYLPISLWVMQTSWNGLFLAEPRWRLAMVFAIGGLVLQIGLTLLEKPVWASVFNLVYFVTLFVTLRFTENVMHPPSPILNSDVSRIQLYFFGMLILMLLVAWQVARAWYLLEQTQPVPLRAGLNPE